MLQGCAINKKAVLAAAEEDCSSYGFKKGDTEFKECMMYVMEQKKSKRAESSRIIGQSIADATKHFSGNSNRRSRLNCTSNRIGSSSYTNCY